MRLKTGQLHAHLQKSMAGIYVVFGDEPLQSMESCDSIREAAAAAGYRQREILEAEANFDWQRLAAEADSLSLFADKKIIDLRIPNGKPGRDGGKALIDYCQRPPADTLLLITLPKLDRTQQRSKWFTTLAAAAVVIPVQPIQDRELQHWIRQRMQNKGLHPQPGVVEMLAERIEGNLLAAAQEIEKLLLYPGPGKISRETLAGTVSDNARYNVFGLADSALKGDTRHCLRMLAGLAAEGVAAQLVLWALTREIRNLCRIREKMRRGKSIQLALDSIRPPIWSSRKALLQKALQRLDHPHLQGLLEQCHLADASIKGADSQDPWLRLSRIVLTLCQPGQRPVIHPDRNRQSQPPGAESLPQSAV